MESREQSQWIYELNQSDLQEAVRMYLEAKAVKTTKPERWVYRFKSEQEQTSCTVTIHLFSYDLVTL